MNLNPLHSKSQPSDPKDGPFATQSAILELIWPASAAALMLRLADDGRGSNAALFSSALMACQYVPYPVNTWQAATQQRAPLFSQQWAASQSQGGETGTLALQVG